MSDARESGERESGPRESGERESRGQQSGPGGISAGSVAIVWHRGDLRVHDHPALHAASVGPTVGVVILDPAILDATSLRRRAFFYENVDALRSSYRDLGSELFVRRGAPWDALPAFVRELGGAQSIHALRSYTPYGKHRDQRTELSTDVKVRWLDGLYVHEPGSITTAAGGRYGVYGPYGKRWRETEYPDPLGSPARLATPVVAHGLPPGEIPFEASDVELPSPGERAALAALERFVDEDLARYDRDRNRLDGSGGSRLSVYFTLGVLSPRTAAVRAGARSGSGGEKWLGELAWRDYLADLLDHRPDLLDSPFDPRWARFRWSQDPSLLDAWRAGRTGVPVVDAAMRQLAETGWISNRARMVAAQFCAKHLRVDWRKGEQVFKHWLLDGDTANNVGNWQWAAGLGVDNAPYFRVFNPVSQGKRHDPDGEWLLRWAPESGGDPSVRPGAIVDLDKARRDYLVEAERVRAA